ncbi:MAG: WD40 repeat domain-containing protein [Cyanobacteria bacterium P01_H01_bin.35]
MQSKQIFWHPIKTITVTALTTAIATSLVIKGIDFQSLLSKRSKQNNYKVEKIRKPLQTLSGHSTWIYAVAISSDGKTIASSSYDGMIKIWHLPTGELILSIDAHTDVVESLAISPNGKILISGSWDDCVKFWNLSNGNLIHAINLNSDDIKAVAIAPDGDTLAIGSYRGFIKLWSLKTGTEILRFQHYSPVISLAFSPNGETLASGGKNGKLKIWEVKTGTEKYSLDAHDRSIWSIAYHPNGETIASGSQDRTIKLWQAETGKKVGTFKGHSKAVFSIAFSPDGKTLASGSYDSKILLWEVETQKPMEMYKGHTKPVWSVGFTQSGKTLVSASADETIKIWPVSVKKLPPQSNVAKAKSEVTPVEVEEIAKLEELNQKLYEQIDLSWEDTPTWYEYLEYQVRVDIDGAITSYKPINQSAKDYVGETPLPKLVNDGDRQPVSQKSFGLFRVILTPTGVLEVSPWWGWES